MSDKKLNHDFIAAIAAHLVAPNDDGMITEKDSAFNTLMPTYGDGVTTEEVGRVNAYVTSFSAHARAAVGEFAVNAMIENADLNETTAKIDMGDFGRMNVSTRRSYTPTLPGSKLIKGQTRAELDFVAERRGGELMTAAVAYVRGIADEKL